MKNKNEGGTRYIQNGHYVDPLNPDAATPDPDLQLSDNVAVAQGTANRLRGAAVEYPELADAAKRIADAAERGDDYEIKRDEARTAVRNAEAERDSKERAALRAGKDPAKATKDADSALAAAREALETAERYRKHTADEARRETASAQSALNAVLTREAPATLRRRLIELDRIRAEAVEAARVAREKLGTVHSALVHARAAADMAPEDELSEMVASSRFDPAAMRKGSNRLSLNGILLELDDVGARLSYSDADPFGAFTNPLGKQLGTAVQRAKDEAENGDAE